MATISFTATRVAAFECEPGKRQTIHWDADTPGLGLRVTVGGARAYIFESRLHGRTVRITIGTAHAWPLKKARTEAARLRVLMDDGKDPREQKAEQRAAHEARKAEARRHEVTVADAWAEYLEAQRGKWSERHYTDHVNLAQVGGERKKRGKGLTVAGPLAPLMPLKLSDLAPERVATWLQDEAQGRPTNAEQSYRKLRAFIRWCDDHAGYVALVPTNAYSARAVRQAVPKTKAKDDCLQREQLRPWFEGVRRVTNPVISAYLQALLLTGARREEMAALRWDDVDFQWRSLHVSDKIETETGRTIPLTPYLASLLLELKRRNETPPNVRQLRRLAAEGKTWSPSPWVFASKTAANGRLAEPRIAHHKALDAVGVPRLSLHGLRRSFGTLAEWCEVPVGVVAQIQGHKPSALAEKHYRRRPIDLLRMWHDKIESWMLEQAGIDFKTDQAKQGFRLVSE
ncbi:CP4-6 prophage; putative phage integrase [Paraburkholderia unamae]|uniref:tyrosine-type recombinase/integrase n=1 Tax=Paraburkholderia unamae TaxID=219649 RepID=UPI001CAFC5BC|nr:integrase family protein [Paraburkholderia unamae]CAG9264442.1 CP4-6 prophage; putative phage integrase [Paraburkholderia unamae]